MESGEKLLTRDQRIVATYGAEGVLGDAKKLRSRARDLPAMLRRHGLLQVLEFLRAKGGEDDRLAGLLVQGVAVAAQDQVPLDVEKYLQQLCGFEALRYLRHQEMALAAAAWLKLIVEARTLPRPGAADSAEEGAGA